MDKKKIVLAVKELLRGLGENPSREGLKETPQRVARMYEELLGNVNADVKQLSKQIAVFNKDLPPQSGIVIVRNIRFVSMCEHHLVPFIGTFDIAYEPKNGHAIGLSKFARIVAFFARRPQLQERLTWQVYDFLKTHTPCYRAFVRCSAEHLCMSIRGVKQEEAITVTEFGVREMILD